MRQHTQADAELEELYLVFKRARARRKLQLLRFWAWRLVVKRDRLLLAYLIGWWQERHRLRQLDVPYGWIHHKGAKR